MKKLYSIYDSVANEYSQPFMANNDECAKRMIINSFSKNDAFHSNDYTLFCLGSFDTENGVIVPISTYVCLIADLFLSEEVKSDGV